MTVQLRPWHPDDAAALQTAATTTPELDRQLGGADLATIASCRDFIARSLISDRPDMRNFAIAVDGEAVGNVGLSNIDLPYRLE